MDEFNNRIDAQRKILRIINSVSWKEELFGLSSGAIERWVTVNGVPHSSPIHLALVDAAGKLFFLANKSQEQITDEYRILSEDVRRLTDRIFLLAH